MICRRCNHDIDTRRRRPDGTLQCPYCKMVYYPRNTQSRPVQRQAQPTRNQPPRRRRNSTALFSRKVLKLPIWVWIVLLVLILIIIIASSGGNNQDIANQQVSNVTVQTNETVVVQEKQQIFPLTVYDANGVRITMTGYDPNGIMGPEIGYTFENNSTITVMFGVGDAYVDGWQITTLGGDTLPAGTKTNGTVTLSSVEMEESNISKITSLTLKDCNIWDDESIETIDTFDIVLNLE